VKIFKRFFFLVAAIGLIVAPVVAFFDNYAIEAVSIGIGRTSGQQTSASTIIVDISQASVQFPSALMFSIKATSELPITDVRLHFTVERDGFVKVVTEEKCEVDFVGTDNYFQASYFWNMYYTGGLPPGTKVNYWWTLTDNDWNRHVTDKQSVTFEDTRFSWNSKNEGKITLYWYSGSDIFAQSLLDAALNGLVTLEAHTGANLNRPVSVYIYNTQADMLGAMLFAQDWTGGAAYSAYGTIVININSANLEWGKRTLVHELAHVVTYQMTSNPYNSVPVWLNEGLSMYAEGALDAGFQIILVAALQNGNLFSVRSMSSPFSTDTNLSYLEYAQSYSLVDYLTSQYGQAKMVALLDTFCHGETYDGALLKTYGFDMDGLYDSWLSFAFQKYGVST